ncbi:DUF4440 domain-containing protein [Mucilaginibacter sp.]|uniref:YybH family protein n=1 Tax=Mucilaginibacter sp. TaxID=1882438 RepID=UPI0028491CF0|nr:DUF4440 domain-containing protein [Mucilaginibacter sp.]MDR3696583.1 DUF4440 domain-containing protein [Mucilaginibacter sp.]
MKGNRFFIPAFCLFTAIFLLAGAANATAKTSFYKHTELNKYPHHLVDTIPPTDIMEVITTIINATNSFNIESVANLYTPNAVIADDEPPYSWNGPTAGVQWVNAIEKACKDNRLTKLTGKIEPINVYQAKEDNVYIVVPVSYTGNLPGRQHFAVRGAFTFVLREIKGKWLVKSQDWMQEKGINGK